MGKRKTAAETSEFDRAWDALNMLEFVAMALVLCEPTGNARADDGMYIVARRATDTLREFVSACGGAQD